jgi:hypothetical protein
VRERKESARVVLWDLAEPLFRLWRRFRVGRSERQLILVLAEFVAAMYSKVELIAERYSLASTSVSPVTLTILDHAIDVHLCDQRWRREGRQHNRWNQ